jgi:hypothetical protein
LAAHDVLGLGEVAEDVEVLQALELVEQFVSPFGWLCCVLGGLGLNSLQEQVVELAIGLEGAYPVDELALQGFGFDDPLAAGVPVAAGGAHVAPDGCLGASGAVHSCSAALAP